MTKRPSPFDDPEYWLSRARSERAFAQDDRRRRYGSVESSQLHEQNAAEYEARALALQKSIHPASD